MDLRRMQTLHSSCCDLGGDNAFTTRWSGGRVQVWAQVWAPANHWHLAITSEGCFRRRLKKLENQWLVALPGQIGEHRHRVFLSQWLSLRVTTSSLYENERSILLYWLCSRVKRFNGFKFWAVATMLQLRSLNGLIFQSFIGLWVKIRHPRIGCLLRFQLNYTTTSDLIVFM